MSFAPMPGSFPALCCTLEIASRSQTLSRLLPVGEKGSGPQPYIWFLAYIKLPPDQDPGGISLLVITDRIPNVGARR